MSKVIGEQLDDDLYARLSGADLEARAGQAVLAMTVDEGGWPHPAMLSYLEVVAKDRRNVRLATYGASSTTGNMRRNRKLTLLVIEARVAYYVKGTVDELSPAMRCTPHNAKLNMRVERVLADEADAEHEAGVYVSSGVTYRSLNPDADLARGRVVVAELLE